MRKVFLFLFSLTFFLFLFIAVFPEKIYADRCSLEEVSPTTFLLRSSNSERKQITISTNDDCFEPNHEYLIVAYPLGYKNDNQRYTKSLTSIERGQTADRKRLASYFTVPGVALSDEYLGTWTLEVCDAIQSSDCVKPENIKTSSYLAVLRTPTPTPKPTRGPCSKDDKLCETESDCVTKNPNECQYYHCIESQSPQPNIPEIGLLPIQLIKSCQFKPDFKPAPTATPSYLPCLSKNEKGECEQVDTAVGPIPTDPADFVGFILKLFLGLAGGIALLLIISSGYRLMASQGNPEKIQEAKEVLTSAIVGLLFIIFSLVLLQTIGVDILNIPGFSK